MKQVSKLLVLFMSALLLLAIPLSAANQVVDGYSATCFDGKVFLKKEFIPDTAATESNLFGKLRLETFSTGNTNIKDIPVDVIMVLDQSGSMAENFSTENQKIYTEITLKTAWNLYNNHRNNLFIHTGGKYYPVLIEKTGGIYYRISYKWGPGPNDYVIIDDSITSGGSPDGDYYRDSGSVGAVSSTRKQALQNAVGTFANAIAVHATGADGIMGTSDDLNHRIAILGYSSYYGSSSMSGGLLVDFNNTELLTGVSLSNWGTGKNGVQFDYGSTVSRTYQYPVGNGLTNQTGLANGLVDMNTTAGIDGVNKAIDGLDTDGATRIDRGMLMALNMLQANPVGANEQRAQVVVVFTDGAPTYSSHYAFDVANNALDFSKAIKDMCVSVYSVGVFTGADNTGTDIPGVYNEEYDSDEKWIIRNTDANEAAVKDASNRFMHYLSSDYPDATVITNEYNRAYGSEYYLAAHDSTELNNVFADISQETLSQVGNKDLNEQSTMFDIISEYFDVPTGTLASHATVKTAKLTGVEKTKLDANPADYTAYTFAPEIAWIAGENTTYTNGSSATFTRLGGGESLNLAIRYDVAPYISVDGSSTKMLDYVKTEGYNYNTHCCGLVTEGGQSTPNANGEKLIIEFPISFNTSSPVEYTDGGIFSTNAYGSGVYPTDPDANDDGVYDGGITPAGLFAFPTVQGYVVYNYTMKTDGTYELDSKVAKAAEAGAVFANNNLAAAVPEGYLYAGYWANNTAPQADNQDSTPLYISTAAEPGKWVADRYNTASGLEIAPAAGSIYSVRCVPDTYLRAGYYLTSAAADASQNPYIPHNLYLTTGVDCAAYKYVGFDVTLNPNTLNPYNPPTGSPRENIVYQMLSGIDSAGNEKNYVIGDMFHFEGETGVTEPTRLFGYLGVAMITPHDGSCVGDEAAISWWNDFISCVYTPFWVTPDNVKVTGVKTRTIDWKTAGELGGAALDMTDKNHLTFSPLPPKADSVCTADTGGGKGGVPDNGSAAPQLLTVWDEFMIDAAYNGSSGSGEGENDNSEDEGGVTPPAPSCEFNYKLVHSLVNRMGQRVVYNTYVSTDDSDFLEIGVIVNGRTYQAVKVGQAPRLANLKYNYVTSWMGYGISTVQAYKVMANGTVVYGEIQNVR